MTSPRSILSRPIIGALVLCLAAFAAKAEAPLAPWRDLPALYDVQDVASDDVLNVRARPDPRSPIIATLAPDARGIEIVGIDESGKWGMIGLPEATGWVSMRYLARQPGQDPEALPRPITCFGTEPFWTLGIERNGRAIFSAPGEAGEEEKALSLLWADISANGGPSAYGTVLAGVGIDVQAVVRRRICYDGMSDRAYGLEIDAILSDAGTRRLISGCCSLAAH